MWLMNHYSWVLNIALLSVGLLLGLFWVPGRPWTAAKEFRGLAHVQSRPQVTAFECARVQCDTMRQPEISGLMSNKDG